MPAKKELAWKKTITKIVWTRNGKKRQSRKNYGVGKAMELVLARKEFFGNEKGACFVRKIWSSFIQTWYDTHKHIELIFDLEVKISLILNRNAKNDVNQNH